MTSTTRLTTDDFGQLYERFGPMVLRRCRYLMKDEEKALDCMQDTFVRLYERRERLSGVCSSLFYTVATSVCLNRIRSDKLRSGPQIDDLLDRIAETAGAHHEDVTDASMLLDAIFADAKEDTRTMAVLHYVDGLTLEETASEMKMSVSGIRKRLSTLRKKALTKNGE
ncbi:MAG TPA: sigma-70 family RNA polymerase sigma factor [Treponemataceae bacterium]|nr:MAG: sigma-70 family RNA polymerase sigma factor [Treponema sp.]HOC28734.1 sigma-70 family RNA polymerase sigma factor [Treponemataceae bacterium]HQL33793.1 sigma-70 family RNA polymerase sigma factor [Treponemataceae bacterium]